MDKKYIAIIEELVAQLLVKYTSHMSETKDDFEYCAVVTAAVVFKDLAIAEFKQSMSKDKTDIDDSDDICRLVESRAAEIAHNIRSRAFCDANKLIN